MEFVDAGFQFFGASIGDALPDQEAETNWQNVNLRAVEKNTTTGACQAALVGDTDITFGFDCQDPATCLTDFASIIITGDGSGEFTQTQPLTFDAGGIASLATLNLNYADAGQLKLIAVLLK